MAKKKFKQIDAFLDGEFTCSELSDFIKELWRNPELSKEIELFRDIHKFLYRKTAELKKREYLNSLHKEYMKSSIGKENNPSLT